jgi:hypothetical protein
MCAVCACVVVPDELLEKVIGALQQLLVAVRVMVPQFATAVVIKIN